MDGLVEEGQGMDRQTEHGGGYRDVCKGTDSWTDQQTKQ